MNTTYFLNRAMKNLFPSDSSDVVPINYYIGLSSTTPSIDGSNVTEPPRNDTGYMRVQLKPEYFSQPANGVVTNAAAILFPESKKSWGKTLTHYVVYDQESDGNLLFYGTFTLGRTVEVNTAIAIKEGQLTIKLFNSTE